MSAKGRLCQDEFSAPAKCCGTAVVKEGSFLPFAARSTEASTADEVCFRCGCAKGRFMVSV